jgi:hypothetical protein
LDTQNADIDLDARNGLILLLRLLLGGIAGVLISSWFYFGLINHLDVPSIFSLPFAGHLYLFYTYTVSFPHISDLFFTPPVLLWGLIGALLASGRKTQIKIGTTLLVIYVSVGCISLFQALMQNPT